MKLVLPVFVTAFVAFVLGWLASNAVRARGIEPVERVVAVDAEPKSEHTRLEDPKLTREPSPSTLSETGASSRTEQRSAEEGLISEALRRYALAEIDAGWHETRTDALPEPLLAKGLGEFDETLRRLPRDIGRRLAKKQGQLEQLASDDPFAVIAALQEGNLGPQVALVQDKQRFASFFACASGAALDGLSLMQEQEQTPVPAGAVISFPAGVHDVESLPHRLRTAVSCVTIRGAGMDQTLLRFRGIHAYDKLDRFELRDCTIQSQCDAIELNSKAGIWRAERVRFIGFDCGAGGSSVFSVMRGGILELKSCRVEGGFGRSPEHGNLFDVRSALLARFEDCTIDTVHINPGWWRDGMTIVLNRCKFEKLLDPRLPVDRDDDGIVMTATTMELRPKDAGPIPKRDVAELFPAWIQPSKR